MCNRKKISVIIPMYNAASFIQQSVQSVMGQTWHNIEILVIDDGSVDRGADICEQLRAEDKRICLYHKERGGVSSARNYGMALAKGEYLFFLDSDDVIPPFLLEEMLCQMERYRADLAFCDYARVDSRQLERGLPEISAKEKPKWQAEEGREVEERFHGKDFDMMSGIGGKMVRRDLVGELRFDEELINGEDTWFLYQLIGRKIRSVFSFQKWYFYRMHPKSATHSHDIARGERYFECVRRIRDCEYQKGQLEFALQWELYIVDQFERRYAAMKRMQDVEGCRRLEDQAEAERRHPLYSCISFGERMLFFNCFHCWFLFRVQGRLRETCVRRKKTDINRKTAEGRSYDRDVSLSDEKSGTGRP
ncbi:MAG: glycosyltransferase family 2 protein [Ruminococcus sp.]|nr:glycosyltransferase family 2 protein [Ruminococcus sp.]